MSEIPGPGPEFTEPQSPPIHDETEAPKEDVYLLGGKDLEMKRIEHILKANNVAYEDKGLTHKEAAVEGIKKYEDEVQRILVEGKIPVAIELRDALNTPGVEEIDHHGPEKSQRPSSISQVLERLGMEHNVGTKLIAANDRAYYPGMKAVMDEELSRLERRGYTPEQLEKSRGTLLKMQELVRRADRRLQGVTAEEESAAEEAVKHTEQTPNGLRVVRVGGDHYSPVADRLYATSEGGSQRLIVVCSSDMDQKEVWFFGDGKAALDIHEHYKQLRQQRDSSGQTVGNEYFTISGGESLGVSGKDAYTLVVAQNPDEIVDLIDSKMTQER